MLALSFSEASPTPFVFLVNFTKLGGVAYGKFCQYLCTPFSHLRLTKCPLKILVASVATSTIDFKAPDEVQVSKSLPESTHRLDYEFPAL